MVKKYGKLNKDTWKRMLHDGFSECMRVLKPYGTLIFKWNETQIPVKDVITAIGAEPLYGNRSGKQGKHIGWHLLRWMKMMDNLENVSARSEKEEKIKKEKVTDLELVFEVFDGKPYYSIKYKNVGEDDYRIGYSSYSLRLSWHIKKNISNW